MNYFSHATAAGRYAQDRPYFHPLVVERIRSFLKLDAPVPRALDVGCGTGQSTLALTEIAASVMGTDISPAMLAHAPKHPRIRYLQAAAERLPLESHSVDLVTVSLAFHWFNRARFLAEARRVLRPHGTLVIYSHGFRGRMKENHALHQWFRDVYLARYPKPPRNEAPFTEQDAHSAALVFIGRESFTDEISYSPDQLVRQLLTHSNVIAAVEQGHASIDDVFAWTLESLKPYFSRPTGTFEFGGEIWYLQPSDSGALSAGGGNQLTIVEADLSRGDHGEATVQLLNAYAMDPMGDGRPLSDNAWRDLIPALSAHPTTLVFLAYHGAEPVGLAICFRGFSTFAARPLLNLHDFYVVPESRGAGVGRLLLAAIEQRARTLGCCKLTLEVQENNQRARRIYAAAGFAQAVYVPEAGGGLSLSKPL